MKITINIPDGTLCAFINSVVYEEDGSLKLAAYSLDTDDLKDGNDLTLPRREGGE